MIVRGAVPFLVIKQFTGASRISVHRLEAPEGKE